jgi:hypothetical protein
MPSGLGRSSKNQIQTVRERKQDSLSHIMEAKVEIVQQ